MKIGDTLGLVQLSTSEITAITTPTKGDVVFNSTLNQMQVYNGSIWESSGLENRFANGTFVNPTAGWYANSGTTIAADTLTGIPYYLDSNVILGGCTIERSAVGSGNLITGIYKYISSTNSLVLVPGSTINTWNTAATGYQTITFSNIVLDQGIYVNVILSDTTSTGNHSGFTTQFPYTPLGQNATAQPFQAMTTSYTYVDPLPGTLAMGTGFWTYSSSYYSQFASFLFNIA